MAQTPTTVALAGGVDLDTPAVTKNPASLIGAENYEPRRSGYRRMNGIERYDGRTRPSQESYWIVDYDAGTDEPTVGRLVVGGTSAATGILQAVVVESGSWAGNDAAGYIVIRSLSGTFEDNETLSFVEPIAFSAGFSGGFN